MAFRITRSRMRFKSPRAGTRRLFLIRHGDLACGVDFDSCSSCNYDVEVHRLDLDHPQRGCANVAPADR